MRRETAVRGVTFDWWHTIAETTGPGWDERMRRRRVERVYGTLSGRGLLVSLGDVYRAYDEHTELLAKKWRTLIDPSPEAQAESLLDLLGLDGGDDALRILVEDALGGALESDPPVLYPHIGEVLAHLASEGYRIGLVSNTGRTWGRYLRPIQDRHGVGSYFHVRLFSDEVGVRKPDPRIFEETLEALGLPAEEVVHVGDDVEADIEGAKRVGMRAVWFNTGFWPGARADRADAEVHDHRELLPLLERWRK